MLPAVVLNSPVKAILEQQKGEESSMHISPASRQAGWGRSLQSSAGNRKMPTPQRDSAGGQESLGGRSAPSAAPPTPRGVGCN